MAAATGMAVMFNCSSFGSGSVTAQIWGIVLGQIWSSLGLGQQSTILVRAVPCPATVPQRRRRAYRQ
ncbi:hypothetical protein HanXRQr2_Chr13g0569141 [Helianthus annuus]|uniref:Uncharacterized protein n=1 Tax=Helianthus annuus TaxID=4232 RepID=A0A251SN67_HELAN|nr:hypothetical protein HanXRQr2_Chr13g0569141 [Helianthus annuus]KAJ0496319.1 hypothetical protein HanHA89_Chr13g0498351 [Helianthus annuus]